MLVSPGLAEAPVLDRMCSQFVLSLALRNSARFNLRRDWASLAFRRRFQYHLELKSPPPGAREAIVSRALEGIDVAQVSRPGWQSVAA